MQNDSQFGFFIITRTAQHTQQARHLMEIRFSVLVVLIVFLALNAAVQLSTLAAVQGLATQQHAVSPPGTDAAALEIALNERRLAFVLATDAKFDEPTNPDLVRNAKTRPATNLHQVGVTRVFQRVSPT